MKTIAIFLTVFIFLSCSTKHVEGTYKSKYSELDIGDFYITLNCDGSAKTIYQEKGKEGRIANGKWIIIRDTLEITYDSVRYQKQPNQKLIYKIRSDKLIYIAYSELAFKSAILKMKTEGLSDSLKKRKMFKNVKTYNKYINRIPIDYANTFKNQFYEKQTNFNCQ